MKKETSEFLLEIKISALLLQNNRGSAHLGEILLVQAEIDDLVDRFYEGVQDLVSADQYEKAKEDFHYFLALIDSTLNRCKG